VRFRTFRGTLGRRKKR